MNRVARRSMLPIIAKLGGSPIREWKPDARWTNDWHNEPKKLQNASTERHRAEAVTTNCDAIITLRNNKICDVYSIFDVQNLKHF